MLMDIVLLEISVVMELEMLSMKIHMYIMLESKVQARSIAAGMVFTIEPMINQGTSELYIDKNNGWTAYTSRW